MEYKELSKWVFAMERVDWELHSFKSRKRELVQARQISIYLANWFWPRMIDRELSGLFNQSHSLVHSSLRVVKNLMFSDKQFREKIEVYLKLIDQSMKNEVARQKLPLKMSEVPVYTQELQEYINLITI